MGGAARSILRKTTICVAALGVLVLLVGLVRAGDLDRLDACAAQDELLFIGAKR
jgi:hypothetical protein